MSVAMNTVQNMGEDLVMMVGYSMFNKFMHEEFASMFPPEIDENGNEKMNIPLEVLSGGASYLFMSAMMEIIRREETFLKYLFAGAEAVISVLWLRNKGYIDGMMNKVRNLRGVKAVSKFKALSSNTDVTNSFVGQVYQAVQTIINGRNASESVTSTIQAGTAQQEHAINREAINLKYAQANNQAFQNSMLLKTMTGSFTEADEIILKKVIGRSNFQTTPLDHNELNKIKEFMIVKDSNGKMIGLTEAFTDLINGLGFINK